MSLFQINTDHSSCLAARGEGARLGAVHEILQV